MKRLAHKVMDWLSESTYCNCCRTDHTRLSVIFVWIGEVTLCVLIFVGMALWIHDKF